MQATISITSKRQATFPKKLLDVLGVKPGDRLIARIEAGTVTLKPAGRGILDIAGTLPKFTIPKGKTLEDMIDEARDEYFRETVR